MATYRIPTLISGFAANNHPDGKDAGGRVGGLRRVAEARVRGTPSHFVDVREIRSSKG